MRPRVPQLRTTLLIIINNDNNNIAKTTRPLVLTSKVATIRVHAKPMGSSTQASSCKTCRMQGGRSQFASLRPPHPAMARTIILCSLRLIRQGRRRGCHAAYLTSHHARPALHRRKKTLAVVVQSWRTHLIAKITQAAPGKAPRPALRTSHSNSSCSNHRKRNKISVLMISRCESIPNASKST